MNPEGLTWWNEAKRLYGFRKWDGMSRAHISKLKNPLANIFSLTPTSSKKWDIAEVYIAHWLNPEKAYKWIGPCENIKNVFCISLFYSFVHNMNVEVKTKMQLFYFPFPLLQDQERKGCLLISAYYYIFPQFSSCASFLNICPPIQGLQNGVVRSRGISTCIASLIIQIRPINISSLFSSRFCFVT